MLGSARRLVLAKGGRTLSVSSAKPSPCQQLGFHKRSWQATSGVETSRVADSINGTSETPRVSAEVAAVGGTDELRHRCLSTAAPQKVQPTPGEGVPRSVPGCSAAAAATAAAAAAVVGAVAVASLAASEEDEAARPGKDGVKLPPFSARSTGVWPFLTKPRVECAYRRKIQDMYHLVDSPVGQGEAVQSVWIYVESQTPQTWHW